MKSLKSAFNSLMVLTMLGLVSVVILFWVIVYKIVTWIF